jgi:glycosyltransferase involved in cell wall biosynthesis
MTTVEVIGPHLDDKGGVSTVNRNYRAAGLFRNDADDLQVRFFPSTRDGQVFTRTIYGAWRLAYFALRPWGFPTIVHLHTSWRGSCVRKSLYAWVAHLRGARVVFHIHPSRFYDFVDQQATWFRRIIYASLRRAEVIVVLTPEMKLWTEERIANVSVRVMPNPVDPGGFGASDDVVRDSAHAAFLGRFAREKGLFELLEAVRRLHDRGVDVDLTLAGGKDEGQVLAELNRLRLTDIVSVRGWLNRPAVAELLRRCTLLVLPSYTEGLPMVLLEAMMCGTPIVSCPVGGVPLIVKHERNGLLVPVGDVVALEAAIGRLLSSPQLCQEISGNNIADASGFRSESIVRDLRLMYGDIAAGIGAP